MKVCPTGYQREEYNESHQLIEEFMLVANEAVARMVKNSNRPTIYRVHEDPDPEKLKEFAELARSHGYEPGDLTNRRHIQNLINSAKGSLEEPAIKVGPSKKS
jgi:ribonuclease R